MLPFYTGKLAFEDFMHLKEEMQEFSVLFQDYASEATSSLHKSKQQHYTIIRELSQQRKRLEEEKISILSKIRQNTDLRNANLNNIKIKQDKVHALAEQLQDLRKAKASLQNDINEAKFDMERLERSYSEVQKTMSIQNKKDLEDLAKYETYTGLQVEAVANDHLKIKFTNINVNNGDDEVYCHLYVGGEDYKIGKSFPALSAEQTKLIEEDLNRHGEIMLFLKQVRNKLRSLQRKGQ